MSISRYQKQYRIAMEFIASHPAAETLGNGFARKPTIDVAANPLQSKRSTLHGHFTWRLRDRRNSP